MRDQQLGFEELWQDNDAGINPMQQKTEQVSDNDDFHQIVSDMNIFIQYIQEHKVHVTITKGAITGGHLIKLNERLSIQAENVTNRSKQEFFPYIHLLFHLAMAGRLIEQSTNPGVKKWLLTTERTVLYKELTGIEKYFFLLETLWIDVDWLSFKEANDTSQLAFRDVLTSIVTGKGEIQLKYDIGQILQNLDAFGLWRCVLDQEFAAKLSANRSVVVKELHLNELGCKLIPVLYNDRDLQNWSIPYRKRHGELNPIPGEPYYEEDVDQSDERFLEAFKHLFPDYSLENSLPRRDISFAAGLYTFRVALSASVWREIVISSEETFEKLHEMILSAYQFDDDHLYSFFMDGKMWSDDCITSPLDEYSHHDASEVAIGEAGLTERQQFLYVFYYGTEWRFSIEVCQIDAHNLNLIPAFIKNEKGASPEQYPDFDDEW